MGKPATRGKGLGPTNTSADLRIALLRQQGHFINVIGNATAFTVRLERSDGKTHTLTVTPSDLTDDVKSRLTYVRHPQQVLMNAAFHAICDWSDEQDTIAETPTLVFYDDTTTNRKEKPMGYWAKATLSYGYDIPQSLDAEWLEAGAPEEVATQIVQDKTGRHWKYIPEVIERPGGGYRLVMAVYSVSGNSDIAPLAYDALDFEYDDVLALRDLAILLGWDPGKDAMPHWALSSEFI